MAKPADMPASPVELRFKPANSNDAARAVFAHHFTDVPRCSFARDDGISSYLGSETGMDTAPATPDQMAPRNVDIPDIASEFPETAGSLQQKLMRGGFGLSLLFHLGLALAIGYATLALPDDAALEQGVTSVTIVLDGNAEEDSALAGEDEDVLAPEKPAEKKPVEKPVARQEQPVVDMQPAIEPLPLLTPGPIQPEILTTTRESSAAITEIARPQAKEKKQEPAKRPVTPVTNALPVDKTVETKPEEKQPEAKKDRATDEKPKDKEKPVDKSRKKRGNKGAAQQDSRKGDDAARDNDNRQSLSSQGESRERTKGNASSTNYKGLVSRKLSRAKGRIRSPGKGNVWVTFLVGANGSISGLRVKTSSGKPAVDAIALQIVRAAAPFPPIPADAGKRSWLMTVPMTFK
jgi:protein TonB